MYKYFHLMKRIILYLSITAFISSCGNNTDNAIPEKETKASITTNTNPGVEKGLQLVATSDCFSCHKIKDAAIGPSYEAIADKYPNNENVIDSISKKIIKGGAGNWGTVPMTSHPAVSSEDAKLMVTYILSLKS